MLSGLVTDRDSRLIVGFDTADDAGIFKVSDDTALVQTLDFLTPMVNDPFDFGRIAAANALNDVYAMGGEPLTAMNIVCFPSCLDASVLREILRGGQSVIKEAGAVLVGGHTVDDNEPKYGLAVTGLIHPDKVIANQGAKAGDLLYLTKMLGTGVISTAIKGEMATEKIIRAATDSMACINRSGRDLMVKIGVNAATDITGFGLLGHLMEMCVNSGVKTQIWADSLLFLEGALELADMGLIPAGAYDNQDHLGQRVSFGAGITAGIRDLVFSPETSGGLLIAVSPDRRDEMDASLRLLNVPGRLIGRVISPGEGEITVVRSESDG